jgi:hypothetical protein
MPPDISRFSQRSGALGSRDAEREGRSRASAQGMSVTAYADLAHARSQGALAAASLHDRHVVFQPFVVRWREY